MKNHAFFSIMYRENDPPSTSMGKMIIEVHTNDTSSKNPDIFPKKFPGVTALRGSAPKKLPNFIFVDPLWVHIYCDVQGSPCLSKTGLVATQSQGGSLETPSRWHVTILFL